MINFKNKFLSVIVVLIILCALNQVRAQNSLNQLLNNPTQPTEQSPQPSAPLFPPSQAQDTSQAQPPVLPTRTPQQADTKKKKRFHFFWQSEVKERHKKEIEDLKKKQELEVEALKKKIEAEKAQKASSRKKVMAKQIEIMLAVQKAIDDKVLEIKEIQKSDNTVEVITNEEDPLYIKKAHVLKSKTNFIGIKDIEFKYRLELDNQTPKVINFAFIVWERKLPFNNTQTLSKEVTIAKPITPYEKRIFEYNELDSKRNGETYKVKITKIVFDDGTQWKNPAVKGTEL